jgi:hypothetical protein
MKRNGLFFGMLGILLVLGIIILGCDTGNGNNNSNGGSGDDNPFIGTWTGTGPGPVAVVVVMTEAKTFTQTQTGSFNGSLRGNIYVQWQYRNLHRNGKYHAAPC